MRLALICVACGLAAVTGCVPRYDQTTSVRDVTRSEVLILKKRSGEKAITGISIDASGVIAGSAEIQLILNGAVYQKRDVKGSFRAGFGGDWYSDVAEIRYVPNVVTEGRIKLNYRFYER